MIYDRVVTIHSVAAASSPLERRLDAEGQSHYCAELTVGIKRFWTAKQVGDQIDAVLQLPRADILSTQIAVYNGHQYRISQVQQTVDDDGLEASVLSLSRLEALYDISKD